MTQSLFRYTKGVEQSSIVNIHVRQRVTCTKRTPIHQDRLISNFFSRLVACVVTLLQQITDCLYLPVCFYMHLICSMLFVPLIPAHKISSWNETMIWSWIQSANSVPIMHTSTSTVSKQANERITRPSCSRQSLIPRSCPIVSQKM
jgi:hypothetical protein